MPWRILSFSLMYYRVNGGDRACLPGPPLRIAIALSCLLKHYRTMGDTIAAGAKAGIAVDPRSVITIRSRWGILLVNRGKAAGND